MKDYRVTYVKKKEARLVEHEWEDVELAGNEIFGQNILSMISTGSERGGFLTDFSADSYPMETGSSSIARVIKTGKDVKGICEGDLFFNDGHHTLLVKKSEEDIIPVPRGLSPEKALYARYAAVSMTSIFKAGIKPVEKVIVTGLGLVGIMCAQVLSSFGFDVYAVDPSPERREIALKVGITNAGGSLAEFSGLNWAAGALMECSGNENAIINSLDYIRKGGEIYQIGVPWNKNSDWDAHSLLRSLFYGFISIHGGWEWSIPRKPGDFAPHSSNGHIRSAMELIAQGKIKVVEDMYELRDPRDCNEVYNEISIPRMRPTCMILDWREFGKTASK